MQNAFSFAALSAPFLVAFILPLLGVGWAAVGSRFPVVWVALYFSLLFFFPNASWGLLDPSDTNNFYSRGTGTFYFSAINVLLFGLALQAFIARGFRVVEPVKHNFGYLALLFWAIILGNVVVGSILDDVRWYDIVGYSGLLNIANFMLSFYVLLSFMRTPKDLERLINILLFCAVARGLWGAVRFFALGGDPANFYSNFQGIDIRLTFFDINDSLIALLALFIVSWRLANGLYATQRERLLYWSVVALELFIIVFSYRRTAWGGLALAAILFAFVQRSSLRRALFLVYALFGVPAFIYKMVQRAGEGMAGAPLLEKMLPDIASGGGLQFTSGRFAELYAALLSIKDSPIWGLGAWGRYDGFRFSELAWHRGDFGWMHSGVLHLMLKSGLLGAGISVAALIALAQHIRQNKCELGQRELGILLAGGAGVLFLLPNWLIGTPVIEFRTMQLSAFVMALPYLAVAAARAGRS
ncbi:MAG: O-antigen ligase family protein [Zoogloeaceae bacterium]|nr:O-antigen ligase family protein [Zoogloeaceae bacterium]